MHVVYLLYFYNFFFFFFFDIYRMSTLQSTPTRFYPFSDTNNFISMYVHEKCWKIAPSNNIATTYTLLGLQPNTLQPIFCIWALYAPSSAPTTLFASSFDRPRSHSFSNEFTLPNSDVRLLKILPTPRAVVSMYTASHLFPYLGQSMSSTFFYGNPCPNHVISLFLCQFLLDMDSDADPDNMPLCDSLSKIRDQYMRLKFSFFHMLHT